MQIAARAWNNYIAQLARLNNKAGQLMADYIAAHGMADTGALIDYAYALVTKYGEGSAALAAQMYDELAALQNARVPPAEPAPTAQYGEVARMVQATRNSPPQMQHGVSRLVKRVGADTTLKNALRDGAEFAWVPHGDSCAFCLTLASRGWQKASQAAIKGGHAEHIHANCDCEYAIRFDSRTGVAGYDPDEYLRRYRAAGSNVNALRRVEYAKNKERINAQKRAAYAARKHAKGSALNITTMAEAKDALLNKVGFTMVEDSFTKNVDEKLAVENTKQLYALEQKFGAIKQSTGSICSMPSGKDTVAYVSGTLRDPTNQNLSLCPGAYHSYEDMVSTTLGEIERGWAMPAQKENAAIYSVTHEYGHMLENTIIKKAMEEYGLDKLEKSVDYTKKTPKAVFKQYYKIKSETERTCCAEILDIAKAANVNFKLSDNLSQYGKTNYAEFFAEVFANSQLGAPNELGKAMTIWLERNGLVK